MKAIASAALGLSLAYGVYDWAWYAKFGIEHLHFKPEHKVESCMWQYWAYTWPVWKVAPESAAESFVNWTVDRCVKQHPEENLKDHDNDSGTEK